jgi:hypothetical protein
MEGILSLDLPCPKSCGKTFIEWDDLDLDFKDEHTVVVTQYRPVKDYTFILPGDKEKLHSLLLSRFPFKRSKPIPIKKG